MVHGAAYGSSSLSSSMKEIMGDKGNCRLRKRDLEGTIPAVDVVLMLTIESVKPPAQARSRRLFISPSSDVNPALPEISLRRLCLLCINSSTAARTTSPKAGTETQRAFPRERVFCNRSSTTMPRINIKINTKLALSLNKSGTVTFPGLLACPRQMPKFAMGPVMCVVRAKPVMAQSIPFWKPMPNPHKCCSSPAKLWEIYSCFIL